LDHVVYEQVLVVTTCEPVLLLAGAAVLTSIAAITNITGACLLCVFCWKQGYMFFL
jgi:hypothetical protein